MLCRWWHYSGHICIRISRHNICRFVALQESAYHIWDKGMSFPSCLFLCSWLNLLSHFNLIIQLAGIKENSCYAGRLWIHKLSDYGWRLFYSLPFTCYPRQMQWGRLTINKVDNVIEETGYLSGLTLRVLNAWLLFYEEGATIDWCRKDGCPK